MMQRKSLSSAQRGFTLIEVMVAIAILGVGIITLIAAFGTAISATQNAEQNLIARQKTLEALESVYTARNTQQITFAMVDNIASGGIFTNGPTQMLCPGPDGLDNTADDANCPASGPCAAGPQCVVLPGPDGILGTADDVGMSLANFTRQIQINSVLENDGVTINPNLKQIVVTVTYIRPGTPTPMSYSVDSLISAFR
jgi:prepilin-type N-terminal cleavage/methylation domain-containing protein